MFWIHAIGFFRHADSEAHAFGSIETISGFQTKPCTRLIYIYLQVDILIEQPSSPIQPIAFNHDSTMTRAAFGFPLMWAGVPVSILGGLGIEIIDFSLTR